MDVLPDEITLAIFAHLPPGALANMACVSWRCNRLAMDDSLWRRHYEARCPPCTGPRLDQTCMAHKGRGLDHRPWLEAARRDEDEDDHFLARPYASHPLTPFIKARAADRDGAFYAFARPPAYECPHHCPSVIRARSYRWALASQCAPPRPIDSTGVRVGSGPWSTGRDLVHHGGFALFSRVVSTYRGEWHARKNNKPDGLGMDAMHQTATGYTGAKDVRAVSMWRNGDYAGFVRHWECTQIMGPHVSGHPNYREGRCRNDTGGWAVRFSGAIAEGKTGTVGAVALDRF
ncbi:F-box domain containing protein [Pandoravirus salinus]|uniref:F-box domain containing protein n=1 Tax=Pandoravirus salinus TaxID=1349410 RepID=S4W555_9VIRU|nr:F-box domain [Pandoravirus salinus]AGO85460.1 F-box domain containing protein [Pandoravirus salinus]